MNTRQLILTALATLVIFVAGIGTGHRLARTNLPPPFRTLPQPPGGTPMMGRLDQFARMVRDLDLDPTQQQRINRLIGERQEYLADLVRLLDPELHEMMPRLRRDVVEVLRPDQREQLERRFNERLRRERREMPEPRRMMPMRENQAGVRPDGQRPPRPGPNANRPPPPDPEQPE